MAYPMMGVGVKNGTRRAAKNGAVSRLPTADTAELHLLRAAFEHGLLSSVLPKIGSIAFLVDRTLRVVAMEGALAGSPAPLEFDRPEGAFREMLRAAIDGTSARASLGRGDFSYDVIVEPVRNEAGTVIGAAGLAFDITAERDARDALDRKDATLQRAMRLAHCAYWRYDILSKHLTMSDEMLRLYHLAPDANPNRDTFISSAHPGDRQSLRASLIEAQRDGTPCKGLEYRIISPDDELRWILQHIEVVRDEAGNTVEIHGTALDITERKLLEERLRRLAQLDELTSLPNRSSFTTHLDRALYELKDEGEKVALLYIDVDGFKSVNDTYGHGVGDQLLRDVAHRISKCLQPGAFLARSGGDEFVVLVTGVRNGESVGELAEHIAASCSRSYWIADRDVYSPVSIGVSLAPDDGITSDDLLRNADSAMYAAKSAGRNTYRFYSAAMHEDAARELAMENDLRRAIERNELFVLYQPIVDVDGKMVAVEALARWQHPTLGLVPPSTFIPIAERTRLITEMGAWIARTACRDLKRFREKVLDLRLAINVSARQFDSDNLSAVLEDALEAAGLDFDALDVEITESLVMSDFKRAAQVLGELRKRGARVSIDDFGTGYSSLAALKSLPIDNLKIDRSFIKDLEVDRGDSAIVGAILNVAGALDLNVVAEGVETTGQFDVLNRLGCPSYQGFAFSRPVDRGTIEACLHGDHRLQAVSI